MINKVILVGNVGQDPDVKTFEGGTRITNFSVATSDDYFDKGKNEWVKITDWSNITVFKKEIKIVKGDQVYIEGKMKTRSYEKDGRKVYVTEVIANTVRKLGRKESESPF